MRLTDGAVSARYAEIVRAPDAATARRILAVAGGAMLARLADLTHADEDASPREQVAHVLEDAGWGA